MAHTTAVPQHVTALLSHLTSRPGVQSTFILSRKDGSIIQSTGFPSSEPTSNNNSSTVRTSPVTEEPSNTSTVPAESSSTSTSVGTTTSTTAPTLQKSDQLSQAEVLAARVFAFVSSASDLSLSLSENSHGSKQARLNGTPEGLGNGTSREDGEGEGLEREEEDEVKLLRLRTKKHEIVVVPDRKYLLCVVIDAAHSAGGAGSAGVRSSR